MKQTLSYFWKLSLCSLAFFIGISLTRIALDALGFQSMSISAGTETNTKVIWILLGSMLLAFVLSFFSRGLKINWLGRWFILLELFWLLGIGVISVGLSLSMEIGFLASLVLSLLVMLNFLLPSLLLTGAVTVLFKPAQLLDVQSQNKVFVSRNRNPVRVS